MSPNISQLRDLHLPTPIGWWPPALGWWLLAALLMLLIIIGIFLIKRLIRRTAIKLAKKLLLQIKQNTQLSNHDKLTQISILIRRTAISIFPHKQVASITGDPWLKLLDASIKSTKFSQGCGKILGDGPYRQPSKIDLDRLLDLSGHWLKHVKF